VIRRDHPKEVNTFFRFLHVFLRWRMMPLLQIVIASELLRRKR
jgi:hypothetical protein